MGDRMNERSRETGNLTLAEFRACEEERARQRERALLGVGGDWTNEEGARLTGSYEFAVAQAQGNEHNPAAGAATASARELQAMQEIIDDVREDVGPYPTASCDWCAAKVGDIADHRCPPHVDKAHRAK